VFPVTSEVLARAGIADSLVPRTLQALQTLDLVRDNGNPTDMLEGLRLAPEAEFKQRLADWLRTAYADVFAFVDPSIDDEVRIRDAFRNYQPIGQQPRMVTLFQGLCSAAGLIPEKPRVRVAVDRPRTRPHAAPIRPINGSNDLARNSSLPKTLSTGLPPALAGLLESLPKDGWTVGQRDKFVTTFKAVLDYVIPVVETAS
jgi:hypothetical protein